MQMTTQVMDAPLDIWGGGGGARVFVACKLFTSAKKQSFLAMSVRQFCFMLRRRNEIYLFVVCLPYYVCYYRWFFWSIYFSSISTKNFFIPPTYFLNIFSTPPPRYQIVRPLLFYLQQNRMRSTNVCWMLNQRRWRPVSVYCITSFSVQSWL